jgi:hypothetical protein
MSQVVIDMTMSLDGFVAGPDDGKAHPLGRHGGEHIFDWYFSGTEEVRDPLFRPAPGANRDVVERMFAESGAFVFGRRTYDITNGWVAVTPSTARRCSCSRTARPRPTRADRRT